MVVTLNASLLNPELNATVEPSQTLAGEAEVLAVGVKSVKLKKDTPALVVEEQPAPSSTNTE
jgi:hypothetical protein